MPSRMCTIVPPHLLRAIMTSPDASETHRKAAQRSLASCDAYACRRERRLSALAKRLGGGQSRSQSQSQSQNQNQNQNQKQSQSQSRRMLPHGIVPGHLLKHISNSDNCDDETRARARRDLEHIEKVRASRQTAVAAAAAQRLPLAADRASVSTSSQTLVARQQRDDRGFYRAVYDAHHADDEDQLPGALLRVEGETLAADRPANEAYDNVGRVLDFYLQVFNWRSIDNKNMHVLSSVHYGSEYENAFWDPDKMQMVFGDGHDFLYHFTRCIDVIGHELTHAVTEHTSPLDYHGQSGALNEHISDAFGVMIKQRAENETADKADWLIGEGCLLPGVKGVALRSMKAPGTAYDDPRFGKDPQPADMLGYHTVWDDNGGVHLYSGIPNRAFYLAAVGFGGYSWEKAGQVWWKALNSGRVPPKCTFLQFADVTVDVAEGLYGDEGAKIVRGAWDTVGVVRKNHWVVPVLATSRAKPSRVVSLAWLPGEAFGLAWLGLSYKPSQTAQWRVGWKGKS